MWWLAHRVEELRNSGLSDNEIRVVIHQRWGTGMEEIEDALLVADAHDMKVLGDNLELDIEEHPVI